MKLIATLGSNPLPVVVSALHLGATELHLIVTGDVLELATRVFKLLEEKALTDHELTQGAANRFARGEIVKLDDTDLEDPAALSRTLSTSIVPWAQADLSYTGGTKYMATQVHSFWRSMNPTGSASYLGENSILVGGTGGPVRATLPKPLTLADLAGLHFSGHAEAGKPANLHLGALRKAATRSDLSIATTIRAFVQAHGWALYRSRLPAFRLPRNQVVKIGDNDVKLVSGDAMHPANFKTGSPFLCHRIPGLEVTFEEICTSLGVTNKEDRVDVAKLVEGEWLEIAIAKSLRDWKLFDEVAQDAVYTGSQDTFQADVLAVKGHRAHLFTCTTDDTASLCKSKLFEGMHRVNRIGGEYARTVLVCMAQKPLEILRLAREDGWKGYDGIRVFGHDHVRGLAAPCWRNQDGTDGPDETMEESLREWVK